MALLALQLSETNRLTNETQKFFDENSPQTIGPFVHYDTKNRQLTVLAYFNSFANNDEFLIQNTSQKEPNSQNLEIYWNPDASRISLSELSTEEIADAIQNRHLFEMVFKPFEASDPAFQALNSINIIVDFKDSFFFENISVDDGKFSIKPPTIGEPKRGTKVIITKISD